MKVCILYHPVSEFARAVEDYARDFEKQKGKNIDILSLETVEGSQIARRYDITRYPAVLAVRDTGEMLALWQDQHLPLMNEVAGYLER